MKNRLLNKLKSNSGESITETLVAVLIAALALLMLAGTVNTASNLITQSQDKLTEYYSLNNEIENRTSSSNSEGTFTVAKDQTVAFTETEDIHDFTEMNKQKVTIYKNLLFANKPVSAYQLAE